MKDCGRLNEFVDDDEFWPKILLEFKLYLTEVNLFLNCENEFGRFGLSLLDEGEKTDSVVDASILR